MTERHYTGICLKDAITTAACILMLGTSVSSCKNSETVQGAASRPESAETPKTPADLSLDEVISRLNQGLDDTSKQVQAAMAPHAAEIRSRTEEEVSKLFQWEYRVVDLPSSAPAETMQGKLSELGLEGWECISILPQDASLRVTCKRKPPSALAYLKYIPGL